jgi:hypothetical protein
VSFSIRLTPASLFSIIATNECSIKTENGKSRYRQSKREEPSPAESGSGRAAPKVRPGVVAPEIE